MDDPSLPSCRASALQRGHGLLPHLEDKIIKGQAMVVACPAFLGHDGAVRCGLPAEVEARYTVRSTDGPLESAKIRCPHGHWFNGPIESLSAPEWRWIRSIRSASGWKPSGTGPFVPV
jgi:hypothetical protein